MVQNKIYQNFIIEILKTFLVILFGLSLIAWTVRAVNFLDLIVENGHSIFTYFQYSFFNFISILTRFIPLAFLLSLIIFIIKEIQDNEFIILWTSGVKKIKIVNLFFITSISILFFYMIFSVFLTPTALNKSRQLIGKEGFNTFLPTIRVQQFSDSFKGFTFLVEKKINNEIENVFIHDNSNTLKNLTSNDTSDTTTTILAEKGIVEEKNMLLLNGEIISSKKNQVQNNIVKFEQLNIDLSNLQTGMIKNPKLQETSTADLLNCMFKVNDKKIFNCNDDTIKEIITVIQRRIIFPFYIPVISLICSFLLIKTNSKNNFFLNKFSVFLLCFLILLYAELIVRYTGISRIANMAFMLTPIISTPLIYSFLLFKFKNELSK
jgi:lipopolysaccharide export system permease protein